MKISVRITQDNDDMHEFDLDRQGLIDLLGQLTTDGAEYAYNSLLYGIAKYGLNDQLTTEDGAITGNVDDIRLFGFPEVVDGVEIGYDVVAEDGTAHLVLESAARPA